MVCNVKDCDLGSKTDNLWLFIFSSWNSLLKMSKNGPKIVIFQFWINRPIWPILMICKLDKVSLGIFTWFSRYWANRHIIRRKIGFFEVKCHFWAFSHKCKNRFFVEYSTGVEISTVKFCEKKLMTLVDIHHKYLEVTLITYENIQKANWVIFFFDLTVENFSKFSTYILVSLVLFKC